MLVKINSAVLVGVEAKPIIIEIDISKSWPGFQVVGLGDTAIQEAKERIRVAWKNTLQDWPFGKGITINLAPADLPKEGTGYDLPMAIGMYLAHYEINTSELDGALVIGELALDGAVRPIPGALPMAQYAQRAGFKKIFIAQESLAEVGLVKNISVYCLHNLLDIINHILGKKIITPTPVDSNQLPKPVLASEVDFAYIKGQEFAKRALEIAAAGAHNILLTGVPGAGKTLLARALPSILPPLNQKEIIEVTAIYSTAGLLSTNQRVVCERPFRTPHHSASTAALVGGGRNPRPGEVTLAHRGVLFLDELPEFPRYVLESLRQPIEDRLITVSRASSTVTFPAQFMLVASQNPCPCGYFGDVLKKCLCAPQKIAHYQKKISGPLLDRIDMQVTVPRVDLDKLAISTPAESSEQISLRVKRARQIQEDRFENSPLCTTNSEMQNKEIKKFCPLSEAAQKILHRAAEKLHFSARVYHRLIKLARTIADLEAAPAISAEHLAEALQYRGNTIP